MIPPPSHTRGKYVIRQSVFGLRLGNLLCLSHVSESTSQHSSDNDDGTHPQKKKKKKIAGFHGSILCEWQILSSSHLNADLSTIIYFWEQTFELEEHEEPLCLISQRWQRVPAIGRATTLFAVRSGVTNDELNHNNLPVNVRVVQTRMQPAPHAVNLAPLSLPAVSPKILDPHNNLCVRPDNGSHCHVSSRPAVALAWFRTSLHREAICRGKWVLWMVIRKNLCKTARGQGRNTNWLIIPSARPDED